MISAPVAIRSDIAARGPGQHHTPSAELRKLEALRACRLAIAERDLQVARARGDMNAVERAISDVNRFRVQAGLPCEPLLPRHVRHPSLRGRVGRLPNGTLTYRCGFGLHVGQRVVWRLSPCQRVRPGVVEQIFEYGRNAIAVFKPDDSTAFWAAPWSLAAEAVDGVPASTACPAPAGLDGQQLELDFNAAGESSLLLMPCSGMKLAHAAPAGEIYTGVMWQTLRANGPTPACMAILSAKHGILLPTDVIEPYELRIDEQRAQEFLAQIETHVRSVRTAIGAMRVSDVFIAGGKLYRDVGLDIVDRLKAEGVIEASASVDFTRGGIGAQRAQLGAYLRAHRPRQEAPAAFTSSMAPLPV